MLTLRKRLPGAFWSGHVAFWLILFSLQSDPAQAEDGSSLRLTLTEASREALKRRRPHHDGGPITSLALHPTKPLLATGGWGERISIWSFGPDRTVNEVKILGPAGEVKRSGPGPVRTGSPDGRIRTVSALAFSNDGQFLAQTLQLERPVSPESQLIRIWNVDDWTLHREIRNKYHATGGLVVRFSPDGWTLATAGHTPGGVFNEHVILLWDVQTGELKRRLSTPGRGPFSLAFSPDGESIIAADLYQRVGRVRTDRARYQLVLWDAAAGSVVKKTQRVLRVGHLKSPDPGSIREFFGPFVSFDRMGRVMELGHDGILHRSTKALKRLPDLAERVIQQNITDWGDLTCDLRGHKDGFVVVGPETLDVWQTAFTERDCIPLKPRRWSLMGFTPVDRPAPASVAARSGYVAVLDPESQAVRVWSPGSPDVSPVDGPQWTSITSIALSPDASLITSIGRDGQCVIWDTQSLTARHCVEGSYLKQTALRILQFSPDSSRLFCARDQKTVVEISTETAEARNVYVGPRNNWSIQGLSRDCSTLLLNGRGVLNGSDALVVYDLRESRERCRLPIAELGHRSCILDLNETGDRLYVADAKALKVSLYDVQGPSTKLLRSVLFDAPDRRIYLSRLHASPDGTAVLLALKDKLQLLDFTEGELRFSRKTAWLKETSFDRAGRLLAIDNNQCQQIDERSGESTVVGTVPWPRPQAVAIDPEHRFLTAVYRDGMILIWKIESV